MSKYFENSRCGELVDAIVARAHGKELPLKGAPAEVKCLAILTTKAALIHEFPELMVTPKGKSIMSDLNKTLLVLAPDLFEKIGDSPSHYERISRIFFADLEDIRNGKLDNPPL